MSGMFSIEGGRILIKDGSRTVTTTDGTLVNLLPAAYDYLHTIDVVFPDFTKDYLYNWQWVNDYNSFSGQVAQDNGCITQVTAPAQEWAQATDLASAPAGADFFLSMVRMYRTDSPSHSWGGSAIQMLQPSGVWLPFSGSVLVEAELGMARAFSIYISGGKLVLHRQQSVSTPPGGYGSYGGPLFSWTAPNDGNGGENVYGSKPGLPVVQIDQRDSAPTLEDVDITTPYYKSTHRRGGVDACSTSLSTNFSSTYQVEISGKFGRRS